MTRDDMVAALERAAVTMQAQKDDDDAALLRALADALREAKERKAGINSPIDEWIIPEPRTP